MRARTRLARACAAFALGAALLFAAAAPQRAPAADERRTFTGFLADGARYIVDVPAGWNGTLLLYSHGYVTRGADPGLTDAPDARTKAWLLAHGFALAASSYAVQGWAVAEALTDQIDVLERFAQLAGAPRRTVAWGHSMGGLITAALVERHPDRFAGALPLCGVLAGSTPFLGTRLDLLFAFKTLLAPESPLRIADVVDPQAAATLALDILERAQATAAGRARIALAAAVAGIPGWYGRAQPEPSRGDPQARELGQYYWLKTVGVSAYAFDASAELDVRTGGTPVGNLAVDYARMLARSPEAPTVRSLYALAGLSVDDDLRALARAARVAPSPAAERYLQRWGDLSGRIAVPVLAVHTAGDGLVPVDNESAYAAAAGNAALLRDAFVDRSSHCGFTPAETIAALQALLARIDDGRWRDRASPAALNAAASALSADLNAFDGTAPAAPAFFAFAPPPFTR